MGAFMGATPIIDKSNRVVITGSNVIKFHTDMTGEKVKVINSKCYIDGYEFINNKWKKTFRAFFYKHRN